MDGIEVQQRSAEFLDKRSRGVGSIEWGQIQGEVVIDELAQISVSGGDSLPLFLIIVVCHFSAKFLQPLFQL